MFNHHRGPQMFVLLVLDWVILRTKYTAEVFAIQALSNWDRSENFLKLFPEVNSKLRFLLPLSSQTTIIFTTQIGILENYRFYLSEI